MRTLKTCWGENLSPEKVKQEYPRPRMVRDSYINLNGTWDYAIEKKTSKSHHAGQDEELCQPEDYTKQILVPFSPESILSGVEHILQPDEVLFYRRSISFPESFQTGRILLHFGAVDQECCLYLDGRRIAEHKGGYLPFTVELTDYVQDRTRTYELVVEVTDATEFSPHARGKQRLARKGHMASIFYTPQSGIWKTVWMECVPDTYIKKLHLLPDYDTHSLVVEITLQRGSVQQAEESETNIRIFYRNACIATTDRVEIMKKENEACTLRAQLALPDEAFHPWSPDSPALYDIDIKIGDDRVRSYFGMRKFGRTKDRNGILRFTLNDKPYFFNGVLDQGYYPDGLLTAPSDEALRYDIETLKGLGFNTIRMHIKIEEERFYYLCDKLGMIVWQDMPNGGGRMNLFLVTDLPNAFPVFGRSFRDHHYRALKRHDERGREQYYEDLTGMVELLKDYPCIALWTPFNEGWGQFDAAQATKCIQNVDNTRLINEACGWFDQGGGDVYSIHNYLRKFKCCPQRDRIVALTEFGGYSCPAPGHMTSEKEFGYKGYQNKEELTNAYTGLIRQDVIAWISRGLSAAIYTQFSDVEQEINGFVTYDRKEEKMEAQQIMASNREIAREFEACVGDGRAYQTAVFDLDGTLLNTLEDLTDSVNVTMEHFGFPSHTIEEVRKAVGNGIYVLMQRTTPPGTPEEVIKEAFAYFSAYYVGHCNIKTKPYPGILKLLKDLKAAGYQTAVVSNKNDDAVKLLIEEHFKGLIDASMGVTEKIRKKPAPDSTLEVLKQLRADKEHAIYIGDSDVDKATADAAGLDCASVTWGFRERELLESLQPKLLVDSAEQLCRFLIKSE